MSRKGHRTRGRCSRASSAVSRRPSLATHIAQTRRLACSPKSRKRRSSKSSRYSNGMFTRDARIPVLRTTTSCTIPCPKWRLPFENALSNTVANLMDTNPPIAIRERYSIGDLLDFLVVCCTAPLENHCNIEPGLTSCSVAPRPYPFLREI